MADISHLRVPSETSGVPLDSVNTSWDFYWKPNIKI